MAKHSVSKTRDELKLTRRQSDLFGRMIVTGNRMSDLLSSLRGDSLYGSQLKESKKLIKRWSSLMVELVRMLT